MVRPRQIQDEDLLEVARDCFIAHGPGVSTTTIAEAAGVSQATLFKRFGTKQALMREALRPRAPGPLMQRLVDGPADTPLPAQLEDIASEMIRMFDGLLPCVMTLWAAGEHPGTLLSDHEVAPPVLARRLLTAFFSTAQAQGRMAGGEPEALAMVFIGSVKELAFQRHMFPEAAPSLTNDAYASQFVQAFWAGCAPPEAP